MRSAPWLVVLAAIGCGRRNFNVDGDVDATDVDATGDRANYAFVTSSLHNGALGGLTGADAICQQRADEAGLPGMYVAYLSDGDNTARSRIDGSRGWQRVDGKPLADLPAQWASGRAWYPLALDETGNDVRNQRPNVWGGSDTDGTPGIYHCDKWTTGSGPALGLWGVASSGSTRALAANTEMCDQSDRLYCFEVGRSQVVAPPEPVPGRLAFISNSKWLPAGLANADAICAAEAASANKPGAFRAALPTLTQGLSARFDLAGPTWVRADGVPIVDVAQVMFSSNSSPAHLAMDAAAQLVFDTTVWIGGAPDVPGASVGTTCDSWTSTNDTLDGTIGFTDGTTRQERFDANPRACNAQASLLCLQQ